MSLVSLQIDITLEQWDAIKAELLLICKLKESADIRQFAHDLACEANKISDEDWETLTDGTQNWVNTSLVAIENHAPIVLPVEFDVEDEVEEDEVEEDAVEEDYVVKHNPNQPRDEDGKWTDTGDGTDQNAQDVQAVEAVVVAETVPKAAKKVRAKKAKPAPKPAKTGRTKAALPAKAKAPRAAPSAPRKAKGGGMTKSEKVIACLHRRRGATIEDLMDVTGWLHQTVRANLSNKRRGGLDITNKKVGGKRYYRIVD